MQTVNLKKYYYPLIREDVFVDVSDEVAECLLQLRREEDRIRRKICYYRAYYSLDAYDGIEFDAIDALIPSPEDIYTQKEQQRLDRQTLQRLKLAIETLSEKQARRLKARHIDGMKLREIAQQEQVSIKSVTDTLSAAIHNVQKEFQKNKWMEDF